MSYPNRLRLSDSFQAETIDCQQEEVEFMAETTKKNETEAIASSIANTNLSKIGFEVYQPNRSGSSFTPTFGDDDAAPEEAFLEAWVNAGTPDFNSSSTPIPQADELARRYGFNAPLINGNLMRMLYTPESDS